MNWNDIGQHNRPHFHAYYAEHEASFSLEGEIIAGGFPAKQAALVRAWSLLHNEELAANWTLASNGEDVFRIDPLR